MPPGDMQNVWNNGLRLANKRNKRTLGLALVLAARTGFCATRLAITECKQAQTVWSPMQARSLAPRLLDPE